MDLEKLDDVIQATWGDLNRAIEDGRFGDARKLATILADYLQSRVTYYGDAVPAK